MNLPPIFVNTPHNQQKAKVEPQASASIGMQAQNLNLPPIIVNSSGNQGVVNDKDSNEVMGLRNKIQQLSFDLKAKDESIRWLNQVLAVTKNKAEYYKLSSQMNGSTIPLAPINVNVQSTPQSLMKSDLLELARQLVGLQVQEANLLHLKSWFILQENRLIDKHVKKAENRIRSAIS